MKGVRGHRMINGREYLLAGNADTKEAAQAEAKQIRRRGHLVRIIKVHEFSWKIYQHGKA